MMEKTIGICHVSHGNKERKKKKKTKKWLNRESLPLSYHIEKENIYKREYLFPYFCNTISTSQQI